MINLYYFDGQLRNYLWQVAGVFSGLKVQTGKGVCGEDEFITVPIALGSRDRVVAAIQAGNTQNKPFSLPQMSLYMTGITLSTTRKGIGVVDRRVYLPEGGIYPTGLQTLVRVMPIPYVMTFDVSFYASNTLQMHQMIEQILMIFDPVLQIQTGDSAFDWTKITTIQLTGINNEENMPPGADRRMIVWTMNFDMPIYIAGPADIKNELVRTIIMQLGNMDGMQFNEYNENGELVPFTDIYTTNTITEP